MAKKILAVDDDPDILDALTLILESKGYEVIGASNGLEALDKIRQERPALMILDLLMPRMDGFEVYKTLQQPEWSEFRGMPVLILTSVREDASRRRYELETNEKLEVDDYLEKPFLPEVLLRRVGKLIEKK